MFRNRVNKDTKAALDAAANPLRPAAIKCPYCKEWYTPIPQFSKEHGKDICNK